MNFLKTQQNRILLGLVFVLFAAFSTLIFYRLGVHPFIDWDESIYAQVAREMYNSHHLFDLTYFGKAWYEKPPLMFWLLSASYLIGGVNELSARIPSALAAVAAAALSLRWVWELRKSYAALFLTVSAYFLMFSFITAAYFLNLDTVVGLFMLVALYSWWKAKNNHNWYLIFWIAIGLSVLTKNVVGLFPIVAIAVHHLISWDFSFLKVKKFWYGVLIGLCLILPWHIYQSLTVGKVFWDNYFIYHVLDRFATSLESNGAPFLYYFDIVFRRYLIALVVFGSALLYGVWLSKKDNSIRFVVVSALTIFVLFSIATTKLPSYISAALPLFTMIVGISAQKAIDYLPKAWLKVLIIAVLSGAFIYTGYAFNQYKLAQGETAQEYLDNKSVGIYLKEYRLDLPVYINYEHYKNLGIGFYSNRTIIPTTDPEMVKNATEMVYHRISESVYQAENYLIIVR